jgi:hypothetical protein
MRRIDLLLTLIVTLFGIAPRAWCDSVTISASKDNTIFQNSTGNSSGGAAALFSGAVAASQNGSPRRALIAFDVAASVPAGATIDSAQLTLTLALTGGPGTRTIGLHRLTADWGEGTAGSSNPSPIGSGGGYAAAAGDATWTARFFGSSLWTNPGANGDFNATASASAAIGATTETAYSWLSTPAMVSDIQSWLDNPATNFGWAMINTNEVTLATVKAFYSRSATEDTGGNPLSLSARPSLTINYTIPEPATAVLLLFGGPLLFGARRRRVS